MSKIHKSLINEIRTRVNIVDIISNEIPLKKRGKNYICNCPFHNEKTPSFTVSIDKQIYHCFGCKEGGDVFNFIMKYKNFSFYESIAYLANIIDLDLSKYKILDTKYEDKNYIKYKKYYDIMKLVSDFYHEVLKLNADAECSKYLKERGINKEIISKFKIGFAPNKNLLNSLFNKNNIDIKYALELGLMYKKEGSNTYYDAFKNRIIFPITNNRGHIVTFSGRIVDNSNSKLVKYFHTPESLIFHKSKILFNFSKLKLSSFNFDKVYVCEGITDTIALEKHGIFNSVATLGSNFSVYHLKNLQKTFKELVIFYDNDDAGKEATLKSLELGLRHKKLIKAIYWDKDIKEKDIDEFSKKFSIDRLINDYELNTFKYLIKYYYNVFIYKKENSIEGKKKFLLKLIYYLKIYNDPITTELYLKRLSDILNLSYKSILDLEHKYTFKSSNKKSNQNIAVRKVDNKIRLPKRETSCQLNIIWHLLNSRKYVKTYIENLPLSEDKIFRSLIIKLLKYYENNDTLNNINIINFTYDLDEEEKNMVYEASFINDSLDEQYLLKSLKVLDFTNKKKKLKLQILKTRNEEEKIKLLSEYYNLIKEELNQI